MATIGKYCKAYLANQFRQYPKWQENSQDISHDDVVYLQENYFVTKGVFLDENIIFDEVTPEWQEFCIQTLNFEVPVYETGNN